ncbi:MAG: aspartate ammonia-lyase [Coriobacteriales bacterium]|nr:aspartate ammonia-lyase [Coriobacteriales bacterium]
MTDIQQFDYLSNTGSAGQVFAGQASNMPTPISIPVRIESDSIGSLEVPAHAYYGVQSLRAHRNFPMTGLGLHPVFIKNIALIKKAAAMVNCDANALESQKAAAIIRACDEVIAGGFHNEFIVDAIQGGAGTSANMNMNEVLANRAGELLGDPLGSYHMIHPNDHVNMSQSTNDVIPCAGKLTVIDLLRTLVAGLKRLRDALDSKAVEFDDVLKMGRTQLEDAVPMRLGQTFNSYSTMVERCEHRLMRVEEEMYTMNLGGTAIGSAINVPPYYLKNIVPELAVLTGYNLCQAHDLFDATENLDGFAAVSGALKSCAMGLSKMCNDLRLLSSGPRTGFGEINLPPMQNGSSIMPGKVNPVIPEVVNQAAFLVIGNDVTIGMAVEAGQMELNAFEPIIFHDLFESIDVLRNAIDTLTTNCIVGITANPERCRELMEMSIGLATALVPYIGYTKAAEIAKEALRGRRSVRDLVLEQGLMDEETLNKVEDPYAMTEPEWDE